TRRARRTDQQRGRTGGARCGDLAEELFRRTQCRREPFCRTDLDGECDLSQAATTSIDLRDGGNCSILGWTSGSDAAIHPSDCPPVNGYEATLAHRDHNVWHRSPRNTTPQTIQRL